MFGLGVWGWILVLLAVITVATVRWLRRLCVWLVPLAVVAFAYQNGFFSRLSIVKWLPMLGVIVVCVILIAGVIRSSGGGSYARKSQAMRDVSSDAKRQIDGISDAFRRDMLK